MIKRIACILLCILTLCPLMFSLFACSRGEKTSDSDTDSTSESGSETESQTETEPEPEPPVPPTAELLERSIYLFEGTTYTLAHTLNPTEGTAGEVVWTASSDCVSVQDGKVRAEKEGYAVISAGGETSCVVNVLAATLPTVSVNTDGVAITSKTQYVDCLVTMESTNEEYVFEKASAQIRLRGNSTSSKPKKPYRIKFRSKQNLLGMNEGAECKSWVLLAEWFDDSMIRNASAFAFAGAILTEYSSDFRFVRLELNGTYQGLYVLCEQSQIHEERINIEEAGTDSASLYSGYLYEIDASTNPPDFYLEYGDLEITNFLGEKFTIKANDAKKSALFYSIKNDGLSDSQRAFAERYLKNVFRILYHATYDSVGYRFDKDGELVLDPTLSPREAIEAVIDVESLARKFIHSEIFCNGDEHKKSYYMYVDLSPNGTGLLTFSCPWDFDTAFVHWDSVNYRETDVYYSCTRNLWYVVAMNNEWIREEVSRIWNELYAQTNGFQNALNVINGITSFYAADILRDATKWGRTEAQTVQARLTYEWLVKRIAWLDEHIGKNVFWVDS